MQRPCTVGLTGGLASGKSTVAVLLARRGAEVLDADALVHELYRPGGEGAVAVTEAFGEEVLAADGSVDRGRLGELVLTNRPALERLNAIVHPLVRHHIRQWLAELRDRTQCPPVAVVEAALLVETGSYRDYDLLVVVWCGQEQQLQRAVARGLSEDRARAVLAAQLPLEVKREAADVVVDNSGDWGALQGEVDRAWEEILHRCAR
jgi:dephospho-CoA kinase